MTHVIVVDLGYGDAGKGTTVDWLCSHRGFKTVVRFNGGAQAAHNVITTDGRHHTFAQFGAGCFTPGVATHLSEHMLVEPLALAVEAEHLAQVGIPDALQRLTIDERALLTTPWHRAAGRAREVARGTARHGSCGMGIGETASYALRHVDAPTVADCRSPQRLRRKLTALRDRLAAEVDLGEVPSVSEVVSVYRDFAAAVRIVDGSHLAEVLADSPVVLEGAQGVLLDEWVGFHPYTTWSTTTTANAEAILARTGQAGRYITLGVLRTYTTRHGPGPLVTEDRALAAGLPEPHNTTGRWQGDFRVGHFDAVAHRYALAATGGVDSLVLTHLDVVDRGLSLCDSYRHDGADWTPRHVGDRDLERQRAVTMRLAATEPVLSAGPDRADAWPELVSKLLDTPVALGSTGPTSADKQVFAPIPAA